MASKQLTTYSLQRSGHNAIIKWLLYQNENVDKFREWTELESKIREECFFVRYGSYTGFHINKPDMGNIGLNIDTLDGDLIIQNRADLRLPETVEQNETVVVILRDWRNYVASHIKHTDRDRERERQTLGDSTLFWQATSLNERVKPNLFKEYATHFINESSYYPILFDRWFASKKYRIKICQDLDLHFTDIGKQSVPSFGGGSSFDKLRLDGQAEQMDVLNRYKMYEDDVSYQKLMQDDEIVELNSQMGVYNEDDSN